MTKKLSFREKKEFLLLASLCLEKSKSIAGCQVCSSIKVFLDLFAIRVVLSNPTIWLKPKYSSSILLFNIYLYLQSKYFFAMRVIKNPCNQSLSFQSTYFVAIQISFESFFAMKVFLFNRYLLFTTNLLFLSNDCFVQKCSKAFKMLFAQKYFLSKSK